LRARMTLLKSEPVDQAGVQMTWNVEVEREGATKPVCIAESLARHYP
jgi:acyl dehydratase